VHHLCGKMGLFSKSRGKGKSRCLHVTREKGGGGSSSSGVGLAPAPPLLMHPQAEELVRAYLQSFPVSQADATSARRNVDAVGSAAVVQRQRRGTSSRFPAPVTPQQHAAALAARWANPRLKHILRVRKGLPAWNARDSVVSAVRRSQVVVISGETGCGKSTQVGGSKESLTHLYLHPPPHPS
jgi:hypothetical protein